MLSLRTCNLNQGFAGAADFICVPTCISFLLQEIVKGLKAASDFCIQCLLFRLFSTLTNPLHTNILDKTHIGLQSLPHSYLSVLCIDSEGHVN